VRFQVLCACGSLTSSRLASLDPVTATQPEINLPGLASFQNDATSLSIACNGDLLNLSRVLDDPARIPRWQVGLAGRGGAWRWDS
jgi:hypothetical protein